MDRKNVGRLRAVEEITNAAQLAALLEVSGWPKPGNVHRTANLPDTRYEHFLAGAVAMGAAVKNAAISGVKAGEGKIKLDEIGVGNQIKKMVSDIKNSHFGGNTHLGVSLLFIPLAASAGKTYVEDDKIDAKNLRKNLELIMRSTTPRDAAMVYDAILMVSSVEELGKMKDVKSPDLYDESAKRRLLENKISLHEVMRESSKFDDDAKELVTGMRTSFEIGYPTIIKVFRETGDINIATVHTFLTILSKSPDTFIARKIGLKEEVYITEAVMVGRKKSKWISETAESILKLGGLKTKEGRRALYGFDRLLHRAGGELNPGTSADLTAASLFIAILCGLRF